MSGWGKYDNKSVSGTVAITSGGAVTGSGTAFTTEAATGDFLKTNDGQEFIIIAIASDTAATVINANPENGAIVTVTAGATYTLSEKPTSLASDPNTVSTGVFGVDKYEIHGDQQGGYVSALVLTGGGTGYVETTSAITFSGDGSGAVATVASVANGEISAVTLTNNGSSYETQPTVTIQKPRLTFATNKVNANKDSINYNSHGLTAGDAIEYNNGGGSSAGGLTSGTVYYAGVVDANNFIPCDTQAHAILNVVETMIIATSAVNTTNNQITANSHGLQTDDAIVYNNGGGTSIPELTSGTTYYAIYVDANHFKVASAPAGAALDLTGTGNNAQKFYSLGVIDITTTGNNAQYFLKNDETAATAVAALGVNQGDPIGESGAVAHTGWVKRTVMTGQHAGRIQYETLVAMSKNGITGDAADDIPFPED